MARTANIRPVVSHTFQGAPVHIQLTKEQELRRAVLTCMLWEHEFYRSGPETADRIRSLASELSFEYVSALALEAREKFKLRHVPLWLLVSLIDAGHKGSQVGDAIAAVVQRPDEMAELVSLYWRNGKKPLTKQLKVGLAKAFAKFNEYSLAKFDKPGAVTIRDVMFLCHPKPSTEERTALQLRVANKQMATPDTWEAQLSAGADKASTFVRLIGERKLGPQAILKNLRNMIEAGVGPEAIRMGLKNVNTERVLPFEFITAARYAKQFEPQLEELMFKCLAGMPKLGGETTLLLDRSGSMSHPVSAKSELTRYDAACGLAMLIREVCANVNVFTFTDTAPTSIAPRRGFALKDALGTALNAGTRLGAAVNYCNQNVKCDRLIVLTDEETSDVVPGPKGKGYMINVSTYEHAVGFGSWTRVAGWSESVVDFITACEAA